MTLHNSLLSNTNGCATIEQTDPLQTDILRGYLMERRRALLTELSSRAKRLGIGAQKPRRHPAMGSRTVGR